MEVPVADSANGEQILLVDDNPTNLQVLYKTLDGTGYTLLAAKDGETALSIARKARPSLILLDIMMPGMDGFEVCKRLKADDSTAHIAIIFLSALTDTEAKVHGFSLGAVDYISKPFQADEVLARVRTHIKIHRLERELSRRNDELEDENQKILNSVSEGIFGLDAAGVITSMNAQAEYITGWSAADALGESLFGLSLFGDQDKVLAQRYRDGDSIDSVQQRLFSRSGEPLMVAMYCAPRQGSGAVLVLRDITEWLANQRALEMAREELESQRQHLAHMERLSTGGEMAAGIAHEVNQPLTAVSNYARVAQVILDNEQLDREQLTEVLDKLVSQARRASQVIERLRTYIRKPDADGNKPIDLNVTMEGVVVLAEVDARINRVDVSFEPAPDLPAVCADEVQIQQVALNLIRNAMEAMSDAPASLGGVRVKTYQNNDVAGFCVIDRGCGLSEDMEDELFTPFSSTKEGGMGVGLSICQSIVQAHGGDIGYRPNPEGGAIFYCELPIH